MGPSARCGSSHFEHLHVPPLGSTTEEPSSDPSLVFAKAGALKRHKGLENSADVPSENMA